MSLTTILAIWGAFLSTVVALWTIVRDRRDRGRVKVSLATTPVPGHSLDHLELTICLVNTGRRPVSIVACTLIRRESGKKTQVVPFRGKQFPIKLEEAQTGTIKCGEVSEAIAGGLEEVRVIDSISRVWKIKKRRIRQNLDRSEEIRRTFLEEVVPRLRPPTS